MLLLYKDILLVLLPPNQKKMANKQQTKGWINVSLWSYFNKPSGDQVTRHSYIQSKKNFVGDITRQGDSLRFIKYNKTAYGYDDEYSDGTVAEIMAGHSAWKNTTIHVDTLVRIIDHELVTAYPEKPLRFWISEASRAKVDAIRLAMEQLEYEEIGDTTPRTGKYFQLAFNIITDPSNHTIVKHVVKGRELGFALMTVEVWLEKKGYYSNTSSPNLMSTELMNPLSYAMFQVGFNKLVKAMVWTDLKNNKEEFTKNELFLPTIPNDEPLSKDKLMRIPSGTEGIYFYYETSKKASPDFYQRSRFLTRGEIEFVMGVPARSETMDGVFATLLVNTLGTMDDLDSEYRYLCRHLYSLLCKKEKLIMGSNFFTVITTDFSKKFNDMMINSCSFTYHDESDSFTEVMGRLKMFFHNLETGAAALTTSDAVVKRLAVQAKAPRLSNLVKKSIEDTILVAIKKVEVNQLKRKMDDSVTSIEGLKQPKVHMASISFNSSEEVLWQFNCTEELNTRLLPLMRYLRDQTLSVTSQLIPIIRGGAILSCLRGHPFNDIDIAFMVTKDGRNPALLEDFGIEKRRQLNDILGTLLMKLYTAAEENTENFLLPKLFSVVGGGQPAAKKIKLSKDDDEKNEDGTPKLKEVQPINCKSLLKELTGTANNNRAQFKVIADELLLGINRMSQESLITSTMTFRGDQLDINKVVVDPPLARAEESGLPFNIYIRMDGDELKLEASDYTIMCLRENTFWVHPFAKHSGLNKSRTGNYVVNHGFKMVAPFDALYSGMHENGDELKAMCLRLLLDNKVGFPRQNPKDIRKYITHTIEGLRQTPVKLGEFYKY